MFEKLATTLSLALYYTLLGAAVIGFFYVSLGVTSLLVTCLLFLPVFLLGSVVFVPLAMSASMIVGSLLAGVIVLIRKGTGRRAPTSRGA